MSEISKPAEKTPGLSVLGAKVGFGLWLPEHLDRWIEAIKDPEMNILSDGTFSMPSREHEASTFEGAAKEGGVNFAIYELGEMQFIGLCGLFGVDQRQQTAMLGISIIDKRFWGQGYGSEAVRLAVDYGFRFSNLHNIWLSTSSFNRRAIRAYEKAGFRLIGRRREAQIINGKRYDQVYMDCLRSEWQSPQPGWFNLEA